MPSNYAHYRMGQEVRDCLENEEKKIVEEYPELFLIGLHGPDMLFYYKPLIRNKVNRIGHGMHDKAGKEFFANAAEVIKKHSDKAAYLSYVYGFICHFALDETCHGYIGEKTAASGISHTEIESEFDRMLMIKDGYDPIRHRLADHIVPSMGNAEIIQAFFEEVDRVAVRGALKGMIRNSNLLTAPSKAKRMLIYTFMKMTGNYKEMHGLLINYQKNPRCDDSTERLWSLYQQAKELAITLITEYRSYLEGGKDLNQIYNYTFGSELLEKKE